MIHISGKVCALMAWAAASVLAFSFATPVMAEENTGKVEVILKILDSADANVRADIMELQELKIELPIGTDAYYAAAVKEHNLVKEALKSGNVDFAKNHAMNAMKLFRTVTDLLASVEELKGSTVIVVVVDEKLAFLEKRADHLETVASANNVSMSFSDYRSAIVASKVALAHNDLEEAEEQLALAKSILEDIQDEIQNSAESRKEMKAKKFAQKMITYISKMITQQEKHNDQGDRDSLIQKLTSIEEELKRATEFNEIIEITGDSGKFHAILNQYKVLIADSEDLKEEKENQKEEKENHEQEDQTDNATDEETTNDEEVDEATALKQTADELEDRANALLAASDSVLATVKIQEALVLISTARLDIDEGSYDAAKVALSSAETALNEAEEMIQG
jgi:hypothetical protein